MKTWLRIATDPRVVKRALKYALVVGAILIGINHGDALWRGELHPERLFKMGLTMVVPYLVSTFSSVGAIRQMRADGTNDSTSAASWQAPPGEERQ